MACRALPSFASESYFEALPILGFKITYIVCLFLFLLIDRNRCTKYRHTNMHTRNAEKDRGNTLSWLTSSCTTSVPTVSSLILLPHPWNHFSLGSLSFPSLAHSSPSSLS